MSAILVGALKWVGGYILEYSLDFLFRLLRLEIHINGEKSKLKPKRDRVQTARDDIDATLKEGNLPTIKQQEELKNAASDLNTPFF